MTVNMTENISGDLRYDEPMSRHTSWRAGGKADKYYRAASVNDLSIFLASLPADENLYWLGLGSNTLVRDAGIRGTVIDTQGVADDLRLEENDCVYAGSGVPGARLSRFCARNHLSGAEFFAGIPGLIGGALAMNAGAFGGETWAHVVYVNTLDRAGKKHKHDSQDYKIAYRSVTGPVDEWFIGALMQFQKGDDNIAKQNIKEILARRAQTQPMGSANCGSVFRNPEGDHAARLIEDCGLKGTRIGGAVISEKHANFIINDQSATAADIEALIELIQKTVRVKQGIDLVTEVRITGERA